MRGFNRKNLNVLAIVMMKCFTAVDAQLLTLNSLCFLKFSSLKSYLCTLGRTERADFSWLWMIPGLLTMLIDYDKALSHRSGHVPSPLRQHCTIRRELELWRNPFWTLL